MAGLTEREIEDLVARHPLRAGVPDAVLNRSELAEFFNVSMLTVTAWINAGMPVLQHGGQGKEYELRASHCWAWKCARDAGEATRTAEARAAIEAQRMALVGGGSGDSIEALPPKERREILAVQIEHERFQAQRNQLLWREDVQGMLEQLFSIIRDTLEAAPDRVERIDAMTPKAIDGLVEVMDELLTEVRGKIEAYWRDRPEKAATERREGLFDDISS